MSHQNRPSECIVYIDGACSGNPGPAGVGVVIRPHDGSPEEQVARAIGHATNNIAEYTALLTALERLQALNISRATIYSDSELLVKQVQGEYAVKQPQLKILHERARLALHRLPAVKLVHVRREANKDADRLARRAVKESVRANRMAASPLFEGDEESPSSAGQRSG